MVKSSKDENPPDYRLMADNLQMNRRVIEVFEKISDPKSDTALLAALRRLLKKNSKDSAQLIRRPAFIKKLKESTEDTVVHTQPGVYPPIIASKTSPELSTVTAIISNIASIGTLLFD